MRVAQSLLKSISRERRQRGDLKCLRFVRELLGFHRKATTIQFYAEAEAILAQLPRRGVPMILREVKTRNGAVFKPFSYSGFEKNHSATAQTNRRSAELFHTGCVSTRGHD